MADRGVGYGMESHVVDGNNLLEVVNLISELKASMIENPRPLLLEFMTFRMRGHEEASGTKYVPQELMDIWAVKDPVENYRNYLKATAVLDEATDEAIRAEIKKEIDTDWAKVQEEPAIVADLNEELNDVYRPWEYEEVKPSDEVENIRVIDAISSGLRQSMERN